MSKFKEKNAEDIKKIIEDEISNNSLPDCYSDFFNESLVPPVKCEYTDSFNDGKMIKLWLVLEEKITEGDGYKIVYNEDINEFGLAVSGVFIGYYGSFIDTVENM